ncbi:MAG: RsmB/NOP family class I SAM-dependent RNA methyltransferase [Clostridia bacterium]
MEKQIPTFLLDMLKKQYNEKTVKRIIEGYQQERKVSLRVNTLKANAQQTYQKLIEANIQVKPVYWSKEAFIIENAHEKDIQALEMYEKGEIYLQSLSSMLPPILLNPQPDMDILDMAAAPGGKTTQMAAISQNKAHITACEMHAVRAERLKYNLEKQGATCAYVMVTDARRLNSFFSFDQILLDAPCSGSGTLKVLDPNIPNKYFTEKLIEKSKASQKALLKKAIEVLKKGKEMVYSTCSILQSENEDILKEALKEGKIEIVPITIAGIEEIPTLPSTIEGTITICPSTYYEGFFVAKIRKK